MRPSSEQHLLKMFNSIGVVKFMIENCRLNVGSLARCLDGLIGVATGVTGQAAVRNLYTIFGVFCGSDVQEF
jgi:hypothetical protein